MKRIIHLAIFLLFGLNVFTQNLWNKVDENSLILKKNDLRTEIPTKYITYKFNKEKTALYLKNAPEEFVGAEGLLFDIPMPNGEIKSFRVFQSSVMQDKIQARYPNIQSYKAVSLDGEISGRFDLSPIGFYASFGSANGSFYISPYSQKIKDHIVTYFSKDKQSSFSRITCGTTDASELEVEESISKKIIEHIEKPIEKRSGEAVQLRKYRIAVATSGEWYERYGEGSIENALAKLNSSINRVNEIYERDVAIRLIIIDRNDEIIFTDPETDPYTNQTSGGATVGLNNTFLVNAIGVNTFDIGHVYMLCTDIGGVASGLLCNDQSKGNGVTCWYSNDVTGTAERVIAHELGHQMSAAHTWSNCSVPGQLSSGTAYEPGSGNTIMSYHGACNVNNTSGGEYPFFHMNSILSITQWSRQSLGNTCAEVVATDNTTPTAILDYENGFTIPIRTPFHLDGIATDQEDTNLTYEWQQYNLGPESILGDPVGDAPAFRTFEPSEETERYFPQLNTWINNRTDKSEVLASYERNFTFRFLVRDNHSEIGGVDWTEVKFKTDANSGPFVVGYPNQRESLIVGEELPITWDVANTDNAPVNCKIVNIYVSSDGGYTNELIVANTANDGTETIIVPNAVSNIVRFKVEAADNIFYDISDLNSEILAPTESTYILEYAPISELLCLPASVSVPIKTTGFNEFNEKINFEVISGLPDGASVSFSDNDINTGESTTLSIDFPDERNSGEYEIILQSTSASGKILERTITVNILSNDYSDLDLLTPSNGISGLKGSPTFTWTTSSAAQNYTIEVATSPSFGETTVATQSDLTETSYTLPFLLDNNLLYYWRVTGSNICGDGEKGSISGFHSAALSCDELVSTDVPINISQSGKPTITSTIEVLESGKVQDVNVTKVAGLHDKISNLRMSLTSPKGTTIILESRKCGNRANFNIGFDDDASSDIICPINNGTTFRPKEALAAFNEEERQGTWTLTIEDLASGDGGRLNDFELELCASFSVVEPEIIDNNGLILYKLTSKSIGADLLKSTDDNNSAAELSYKLVQKTTQGNLTINNQILQTGDTFTQADINNNKLSYSHVTEDKSTDYFDFVVEDSNGGWVGVARFNITIDGISKVKDLSESIGIKIYPNPVSNVLYLRLDKALKNTVVQMYDMNAKLVYSIRKDLLQNLDIEINSLSEGLYILKIVNEKGINTKKVIIQRQ